MMLLAGTRQSFRNTSPIGAPSWPILGVDADVVMPGVPRGTTNAVMPSLLRLVSSVFANTVMTSAIGASVM